MWRLPNNKGVSGLSADVLGKCAIHARNYGEIANTSKITHTRNSCRLRNGCKKFLNSIDLRISKHNYIHK